ncbi:MAG: hypothetical protein IPK71_37080 [Myxococcales bacterium]|nr:hypothetical protein [Myxococcales bacterium]
MRRLASAEPEAEANGMKPFTSEAELSATLGEPEATQKKIQACEGVTTRRHDERP